MLGTILLVAAFVLFVLATLSARWEPVKPHVISLIAAGLACWVGAQLFGPLLR